RRARTREQPDQELTAELQQPDQGRQELSLLEASGGRGVSARALLAPGAERWRALVRSVHIGPVASLDREIDPEAPTVSNLLGRDLQAGQGMPRLSHQAVPRSMRAPHQPSG